MHLALHLALHPRLQIFGAWLRRWRRLILFELLYQASTVGALLDADRGIRLLGLALALLHLAALIRYFAVPPCLYCGSRACDHHLHPDLANPVQAAFANKGERARAEARRLALDVRAHHTIRPLVQGRNRTRFRTAFRELAPLSPVLTLAVLADRPEMAHRALKREDFTELLSASDYDQRLEAMRAFSTLFGTAPGVALLSPESPSFSRAVSWSLG